jgi:hypothetical protein
MKRSGRLTQTSRFVLAAAVVVVFGTTQAQEVAPMPPPPPSGPDFLYRAGGPGGPDDPVIFIRFEAELGGKTVTGAPFAATFSTQTKQVLADGNQIVRNNTGSFARDSQGRTRRDMTFPGIGILAGGNQAPPHVVMINDPVAGSQYILEVDRKIARRVQSGEGKHKHGDANDSGAAQRARVESNVTKTPLGTQTINGVLAEGTRTTRTIPAGAIGNANPIVIAVERWYSPDLQTVILMKRDDPRMGETTFQLTNIQRQEPDPSLFQVPADYTVKQGRGGHFLRRMGPPLDAGASAPPPSVPQN